MKSTTGDMVCLLSLGHYGSHEQDWGAYTQEVAKVNMKRYCIVGNTTYDSRGSVANTLICLQEGMNEINSW